MAGIAHWAEPEDVDSLSYIDFEDEEYEPETWAWHADAIRAVLGEVGVDITSGEQSGLLSTLYGEWEGREDIWQHLENIVTAAGFDVYNSDTRFEVFPPESYCGMVGCQCTQEAPIDSDADYERRTDAGFLDESEGDPEPVKVRVTIVRNGGIIESVDVDSDAPVDFTWTVEDVER